MGKKPLTTRDMSRIALMAVVLSVCSWISVPAPVPFTMQTFAVFCALGLLGGRRGSLAVLLYILLGAVGLPVFSGFQGGVGKLLGPTGGYILGFLLAALLYRLLERWAERSLARTACTLLLGLAVCYAFGTVWFVTVYARGGSPIGYLAALGLCVYPFILPDLIKLALALLLIRSLKKYVRFA
ncbi:MAG: biotin transporter BioY [Oscillospiraceae bacterium]|nr:biotin transporter BioY [Oscillospiraceae bacterium]